MLHTHTSIQSTSSWSWNGAAKWQIANYSCPARGIPHCPNWWTTCPTSAPPTSWRHTCPAQTFTFNTPIAGPALRQDSPQIREGGVAFSLHVAALQQNVQLIEGAGRLQLAAVRAAVPTQRVLGAQLLQLQDLGRIGEPVHALAVAHVVHHESDFVRSVFVAGQFDYCVWWNGIPIKAYRKKTVPGVVLRCMCHMGVQLQVYRKFHW